MHRITVDQGLGDRLSGLEGQAVLCDASGRALGMFSPLSEHVNVSELQLEPPLSFAETEELRKNRTGKPLEEILRRLGVQ